MICKTTLLNKNVVLCHNYILILIHAFININEFFLIIIDPFMVL